MSRVGRFEWIVLCVKEKGCRGREREKGGVSVSPLLLWALRRALKSLSL